MLEHRTKSKWLPNRPTTRPEREASKAHWPDAQISDKEVILGSPIGHNVCLDDFVAKAREKFDPRSETFRKAHLSYTMRVLAVNMFIWPVMSYPARMFILPSHQIAELRLAAMRLVSPAPFCSNLILTHCCSIFGVRAALRDLRLDNVASVLATAFRLHASGSICDATYDRWRHEYNSALASDTLPRGILLEEPRPLNHFFIAYSIFREITGQTPDAALQIEGQQQTRGSFRNAHQKLYRSMMAADKTRADDDLKRRFRDKGIGALLRY